MNTDTKRGVKQFKVLFSEDEREKLFEESSSPVIVVHRKQKMMRIFRVVVTFFQLLGTRMAQCFMKNFTASDCSPSNGTRELAEFEKPSEMDNVKATTEQLRVEAQIVRKKVSEVSKDLMEFCEKNKASDMLVSGPSDQHNPFQEKKSCNML